MQDIQNSGGSSVIFMRCTEIQEFSIGHAQNEESLTGCTVILCHKDDNFVASIDVRGGLPGTRNSDSLNPLNSPNCCDAIVLSGGSYFGMAAASGVEAYLEEKGIGTDVRGIKVPAVAEMIIFDLAIGDAQCRPDFDMGYKACYNAEKRLPWKDGNVGAGMGATVGKLAGMNRAAKGGLGSCCIKIGDLYVAAIMTVNAVGNIVNPYSGQIVAGARNESNNGFVDLEDLVLENYSQIQNEGGNTTIGVILTNAKINKAQAAKLAASAQDGLARTIRPVHTMGDGDAVIAVAAGKVDIEPLILEVMAVKATETAILNAVKGATSMSGLPCCSDVKKSKG